jgi:quercetin dioxygenase-like cupin family protein
MRFIKNSFAVAAVVSSGWLAGSGQGTGDSDRQKERARVVASTPLPPLNGSRLRAILVEVHYGPGESSKPHAHPCPVIGYVAEGTLRTRVKGESEALYRAGETFYEPPNGIHLVSANASSTEPAKLLAYFLCDGDQPLSREVSKEPSGAAE